MHQSEQIEPYLRNELSLADKAIFEETISRDPLLKSEVQFQEAVINGIQEYRKNQLKARLANINISTTTNAPNYSLAAVAVAGLLVVGAGTWYFAGQQQGSTHAVETEIVRSRPTINKNSSPENNEIVKVVEEKEKLSPITKPINIPVKKEVVKPLFTDIDTIDNPDDLQQHDQIKLPTGDIAPVATKDNLGVKVSVNNATQYKFHYSFADSKLYLFGDFSQLYEILDFNTKEGKQLYLFYQSNFYKINESQTNVSPLLKVNDPLMIKKLKEAREQSQK